MFGVDDADTIALHALAVCGPDATDAIARSVESLLKLGREAVEHPESDKTPNEFEGRTLRMITSC